MYLKNHIKNLSSSRWDIGFIVTPINEILEGKAIEVEWVKHNYRDSWFADPFILDVQENEVILLAEEYYKPLKKGRIVKLVVSKETLEITKRDVILQLDTHLSFPAYIKNKDDIYIYPENGASGKLIMYKYDMKQNVCKEHKVLCQKAVEDAVLTDLFGKKQLFATSRPSPNGNTLEVYELDEHTDKFILSETYMFAENVARMSGLFFKYKDRIYRPTQECNTQYGHAVTIQEVNRGEKGFIFKEVRRLYSVHPKFKIGMHTFNVAHGMIATDALTFDRIWIRKILTALHILPKR